MANQPTSSGSGSFALDNPTFDLITVIYEKSKGLEAYERYIKDFQGDNEVRQLFEQIRQQEHQFIQQLQRHLSRRLQQSGTHGERAA